MTAESKSNNNKTDRIIHLVRHGQYVNQTQTVKERLTALGREQSRCVAHYLKRWPIHKIYSSDSVRAVETAQIIALHLNLTDIETSDLLREVIPTAVPDVHVALKKRRKGVKAVAEIVERYFRASRTIRHEVIVCHGNLIRAIVCHVLGVRRSAWLRMDTFNCGMTSIAVDRENVARLLSYCETAYLTPELITSL